MKLYNPKNIIVDILATIFYQITKTKQILWKKTKFEIKLRDISDFVFIHWNHWNIKQSKILK